MEKPNREILKGNQINWNQVYYFSEIAAAGSIKEAAERLKLSAPTLSQHLSQLEDDLKLQLFHRQHRRLVLTAEGTKLYHQAKAMFEVGQRLIDVVSPVTMGAYPLSVALVPSPSIVIANRVLGALLKRGPLDMKVFRAHYQEIEEGLVESRFNFGFSDRPPERKDLACVRVSRSAVQFYVAAQWSGVPFSELIHRLPLLICNAEPTQRSLAEQALADADLVPAHVVTSDYPSTLLELCAEGVGIGVFSEASLYGMALRGLTSLRAPRDAPRLQDSLYVLWVSGAEKTAAISLLRSTLEEDGFGGVSS